jgi:hypothetical protein
MLPVLEDHLLVSLIDGSHIEPFATQDYSERWQLAFALTERAGPVVRSLFDFRVSTPGTSGVSGWRIAAVLCGIAILDRRFHWPPGARRTHAATIHRLRGGSRRDPHRFRSGWRRAGRRRAAPAVPWRLGERSGA